MNSGKMKCVPNRRRRLASKSILRRVLITNLKKRHYEIYKKKVEEFLERCCISEAQKYLTVPQQVEEQQQQQHPEIEKIETYPNHVETDNEELIRAVECIPKPVVDDDSEGPDSVLDSSFLKEMGMNHHELAPSVDGLIEQTELSGLLEGN